MSLENFGTLNSMNLGGPCNLKGTKAYTAELIEFLSSDELSLIYQQGSIPSKNEKCVSVILFFMLYPAGIGLWR